MVALGVRIDLDPAQGIPDDNNPGQLHDDYQATRNDFVANRINYGDDFARTHQSGNSRRRALLEGRAGYLSSPFASAPLPAESPASAFKMLS